VFFTRKICVYKEVDDLPNIKSAKKRVLVSEARAARNKAGKSALKTSIKKFSAVAADGNREEATAAFRAAVKKIDQAASKGILHKNTAARKKRGLALSLNKMSAE
jgi:small subunit ribosomal protein S20